MTGTVRRTTDSRRMQSHQSAVVLLSDLALSLVEEVTKPLSGVLSRQEEDDGLFVATFNLDGDVVAVGNDPPPATVGRGDRSARHKITLA